MNRLDNIRFGFREDYDEKKRIVKQTYVNYENEQYFISTIDLGMDHSFNPEIKLYYETMIFNSGFCDYYQERYTTREEALLNHNNLVDLFKNNKIKILDGYFQEIKND